jgi:pimeloyl-ACP methyl ester carboxylesterase
MVELELKAMGLQTKVRKLKRSLAVAGNLAWQRMVFWVLRDIAPASAIDRAVRVFLTPQHGAFSKAEFEALDEARTLHISSPTGRITAWRWGRKGDPVVVLVHGWGGRCTQMRAFVEPIVRRGFSVVAFDAPGHGMSGRGQSSLPHFLHGLNGVLDSLGSVHAVVGHSAGAVVTAMALAQRPSVVCGVLISAPASLIDFSRQLADALRWPESFRAAMQRRVESHFGYKWCEFEAERSSGDQPLLVIHDVNDREAPLSEARRHANNWPRALLLTTKGLGHRRILESSAVVQATVDFVVTHRR